jgi:hypothetical protein
VIVISDSDSHVFVFVNFPARLDECCFEPVSCIPQKTDSIGSPHAFFANAVTKMLK